MVASDLDKDVGLDLVLAARELERLAVHAHNLSLAAGRVGVPNHRHEFVVREHAVGVAVAGTEKRLEMRRVPLRAPVPLVHHHREESVGVVGFGAGVEERLDARAHEIAHRGGVREVREHLAEDVEHPHRLDPERARLFVLGEEEDDVVRRDFGHAVEVKVERLERAAVRAFVKEPAKRAEEPHLDGFFLVVAHARDEVDEVHLREVAQAVAVEVPVKDKLGERRALLQLAVVHRIHRNLLDVDLRDALQDPRTRLDAPDAVRRHELRESAQVFRLFPRLFLLFRLLLLRRILLHHLLRALVLAALGGRLLDVRLARDVVHRHRARALLPRL
mmetsp:Transcript_114/g.333  ORF Transcript_114/g.333 Transcript_114/m.333 type:complete len:332 (+) Transcript_114:557-1552(+)